MREAGGISVLIPSRKRSFSMERIVNSARTTASGEVEFVFYLDDDDKLSHQTAEQLGVTAIIGPRILLSEMWNRCWERATHDVAMHCGDDIVFSTPSWDQKVLAAFETVRDRIALVWGRDGYQDKGMATHGFLHRRWVETLGYFVPPYFPSDYNDMWLFEVAGRIERRIYLPDVYTEHLHPVVGKGIWDQTHQERLQRHADANCEQIWHDTALLREQDAEKLRTVIEEFARSAV